MPLALAATALAMGLAGGPHCTAMCAAACSGIGRSRRSAWLFHAGRLAGYATAGGIAAGAVQSLAWFTTQAAALRPVWTLFHMGVLAWGLMLLALARQPEWVSAAGRTAWSKLRSRVGPDRAVFMAGALWAGMPCGLLYSALLVASLSGGPLEGALSMALFAAGSGAWLAFATRLAFAARDAANTARKDWGTRISGLLLVTAAIFALWTDLAHRIAQWCGVA